MAVDAEYALKTYRYLRVAVIALALMLAAAVAVEWRWGDSGGLSSISAYYYTPVESIFVGALIAIGPALIAIKGRRGAEDTMLDLAGMLAPVVAVVPTPRLMQDGASCATEVLRCVPPEYEAGVENNVSALLVVGIVGIFFALLSARLENKWDRATVVGLVLALAVWLGFLGWFLSWVQADRDSFLAYAHYSAAIPFFALIAWVATINAYRAGDRDDVPLVSPTVYSLAYGVITFLFWLVIVPAVIVGIGERSGDITGSPNWIFYVEAALLVLFCAFWLLQTVENWNVGVPPEASATHADKPKTAAGPDEPRTTEVDPQVVRT